MRHSYTTDPRCTCLPCLCAVQVFIDRDGDTFKFILSFLRSGLQSSLPQDEKLLRSLWVEADFYGIDVMLSMMLQIIKDNQMLQISINIGGVRYESSFDTLAKSSYLKKLLNSRFAETSAGAPPPLLQHELFVDRDGEMFKHILCYLRTNVINLREHQPQMLASLLVEAHFYELDELETQTSFALWKAAHPEHQHKDDSFIRGKWEELLSMFRRPRLSTQIHPTTHRETPSPHASLCASPHASSSSIPCAPPSCIPPSHAGVIVSHSIMHSPPCSHMEPRKLWSTFWTKLEFAQIVLT